MKIGAATTLEVKSTAQNEMWDLLPSIQLCDCEKMEERRGEGYLTAQPWSPVEAHSVIVNTYLHHVNRRACLIIHCLLRMATCEYTPPLPSHMPLHMHAYFAPLCPVLNMFLMLRHLLTERCAQEREQEMSQTGLNGDKKSSSKLNWSISYKSERNGKCSCMCGDLPIHLKSVYQGNCFL